MIRVLIMEDRDTIRDALATFIGTQKDMRVIGEATNAEAGIEAAAALSPDVVVMDLELPFMGGIEATRQIKAISPHTEVIAYSMHDSPADRVEVLAAGGAALVAKDQSPAELLAVIRTAVGQSERRGDSIASVPLFAPPIAPTQPAI